VAFAIAAPDGASSQGVPESAMPLRVLVDCVNTSCDGEFFRTELTFIDHVRQRQDADVHVLVTSEPTGQGGREVTFNFFGQGRLAGREHVIRDTFLVAESQDAIRREMVRVIALGLVPYTIEAGATESLEVSARDRPSAAAPAVTLDPWRRWTFRVSLQGNAGGEQSNTFSFINSSVNANRTTADLKLNFNTFFSYRQNTFELPDGREFLSPNREYGVNGLAAKAINGHWSTGTRAQYYASTFSNQAASWYVAPAIEFDIFPYAESTRRLLTLHYSMGVRGFEYEEETIYRKFSETRGAHVFEVSTAASQRWGTLNGSFEVVSFLPQVDQHHYSGFGNVNLNVFKGLSLSLNGQVSWIKDQIYLPLAAATTEEILVNQRQLPTSYRYQVFFGVSYTFGSVFSSVVNPRFNAGGF
jgi:hypothetical protein